MQIAKRTITAYCNLQKLCPIIGLHLTEVVRLTNGGTAEVSGQIARVAGAALTVDTLTDRLRAGRASH